MRRHLCALLFLRALGFAAQEVTPKEVLEQLRLNVRTQLNNAVDYTCVETVDRKDYFSDDDRAPGCVDRGSSAMRRLYQHDRLRLDVAVADTGEMFSWHGAKQFSTAGLETLVQSGAVSSGTFIGYLRNVFFVDGVLIRYAGRVQTSSDDVMTFNYDVPLSSSRQNILAGSGKVPVPFHGSFQVDRIKNALKSLAVIIDRAPSRANVCFAAETIVYQVKEISERPALIPLTSTLDINMVRHGFSTSHAEFSGCHAFRGESTIHYTDSADPASVPLAPQQLAEQSAPVRFHAAIKTKISGETSYTGDPVRGVLQSSTLIKETGARIPKGAEVEGVITRLAFRYLPEPHYVLAIAIHRIVDGSKVYVLNAQLQTSSVDRENLRRIYRTGQDLDESLEAEAKAGEFVFPGRELHIRGRLQGVWVTGRPIGHE